MQVKQPVQQTQHFRHDEEIVKDDQVGNRMQFTGNEKFQVYIGNENRRFKEFDQKSNSSKSSGNTNRGRIPVMPDPTLKKRNSFTFNKRG